MSKRSEHLAVRALPGLAAELRAYKRRMVREARSRCEESTALPGTKMSAYLWDRLRRMRALPVAAFRASYQSEQVQAICRTPRMQLLIPLARSRRNDVRMVHA